jgi:hypothetical protein
MGKRQATSQLTREDVEEESDHEIGHRVLIIMLNSTYRMGRMMEKIRLILQNK